MTSDEPATASDQGAVRASHDDLLMQAVTVLRIRYEQGGGYPGLSPDAARELGETLSGIAESEQHVDNEERTHAIALAHRLIDNDHPEHSPLWPEATDQA